MTLRIPAEFYELVGHDAAWKSVDENDLIEVRAIAKTLPNAKRAQAEARP